MKECLRTECDVRSGTEVAGGTWERHIEAVVRKLPGKTHRVGVPARLREEGNLQFVSRGRLGELEFEIASVLKTSFVRASKVEKV